MSENTATLILGAFHHLGDGDNSLQEIQEEILGKLQSVGVTPDVSFDDMTKGQLADTITVFKDLINILKYETAGLKARLRVAFY